MADDEAAEAPGKFQKLYNGEIASIRLAVCLGATNAIRMDFNVAVWELNRAWMIRIADSIKEHENRYSSHHGQPLISTEQGAIKCDDIGIEHRFFRLNEVVAEWIDSTQPVLTDIDFIVM